MRKVINCYTDNNPVINKKLKEVSVEEGMEIATKLFQILNKGKDGIGLAANQVGIDASVAVLNVREPIILINPVIEEQWDEIDYYEGCLSYPEKGVHTKRYKNIIVKSAHLESGMYFSGAESSKDSKGSWETAAKHDQEERLLESVCVQHEIDHLMGKTIHDREKRLLPVKNDYKRYGRNEIVGITDGEDYKEIKYKKAKPLIDSGEWVIYVGGPIT